VLNAAADDVAFSLEGKRLSVNGRGRGWRKEAPWLESDTYHWDDVRDPVSAVDHGTRQRPLSHLSGCPGGCQRQDSLTQTG